jgi:hypothetical protein
MVGAPCSDFMAALYELPGQVVPDDSLTCTRIVRNNNVTWNGLQGLPGEKGTGDPAPAYDDDGHGIHAVPEKTYMIRYKLSFWEAGFQDLQPDEWGDEIDGRAHEGVQDIALSGYIYRVKFKGNIGGLKEPQIETHLEGARPWIGAKGQKRAIVRVWTDGQQPEEVDHFPTHCDGVTIFVKYDKLHVGHPSYPNFVTKIDELAFKGIERPLFKACLGDSDFDPANNVEQYNWDYGSKYYPHLVKLVRKVTTYTDGGYYCALYFDGSEFIFLNAFHPPDIGYLDGDQYDVYTTKGTLALTSKHAEVIFGFASKTFFTVRKELEVKLGTGETTMDGTLMSFDGDISCDRSNIDADKANACWRIGCNEEKDKFGFNARYPGKWTQSGPGSDSNDWHRPDYDGYMVDHCLSPNDLFTVLNWDDPLRNPYFLNLYKVERTFKNSPRFPIVNPVIEFTTAGEHSFVVPAGVEYINVLLRGASGGKDYKASPTHVYRGGKGAIVRTLLKVTPGATIWVFVGGKGTHRLADDPVGTIAGGFNGGGAGGSIEGAGGGGATDIRTSQMDLSTRLVVAGGGGGGCSSCSAFNNTAIGGDGGTPMGFNSTSAPLGPCRNFALTNSTGGTRTNGGGSASESGVFGIGGSGDLFADHLGRGGGGGGGWYGGGGGGLSPGSGGSSYCHSDKCKYPRYSLDTSWNNDGYAKISLITTQSSTNLVVDGAPRDDPHRSYMQTNIITSDISSNWAANAAVQDDDATTGQYMSGFHVYKFIPHPQSQYRYMAPCSNRGICGETGLCKCFPGYSGGACETQATLMT